MIKPFWVVSCLVTSFANQLITTLPVVCSYECSNCYWNLLGMKPVLSDEICFLSFWLKYFFLSLSSRSKIFLLKANSLALSLRWRFLGRGGGCIKHQRRLSFLSLFQDWRKLRRKNVHFAVAKRLRYFLSLYGWDSLNERYEKIVPFCWPASHTDFPKNPP